MAEAAAAIYNVEPKELEDYAHNRAVAMILPRHQGDGQEIPTDWEQINELLIRVWQSLYESVQP